MIKIFVSVVSYRDPLLKRTVRSLLDQQSGDNKIIVGIFEQTCLEDSLVTVDKELTEHPDVRYKRIDPEYADGVVWARKVNCSQIVDENFIYQVDSHILYDKDWDRFLINDWEMARQKTKNNKALLTGTCHTFYLEDDKVVLNTPQYPVTTASKYFTITKRIKLPAAHGEHVPKTEDVTPAIHIFAGNFFAPIRWVEEIGYDSRIFFEGEEHYMVLKSFMNGWSMFHPTEIHCYHYHDTHNYPTKHWIDPVVENQYGNLTRRGHTYWLKFLESVPETVLQDYYEYSGLDYINLTIDDRARTLQILDPYAEED